MKLYYVASQEVLDELPNVQSHWLDLGNGHVLIAVEWDNDFQEQEWSIKEGVLPLPHPVFNSADELTDEHLGHLTQRFPLEKGNNVHHAIKAASRHDPWMRCHVL